MKGNRIADAHCAFQDNQINRTVLRRQLTKEGCEVLLACDGQEGLDQLQSRADGTIDCVLMDIEVDSRDLLDFPASHGLTSPS